MTRTMLDAIHADQLRRFGGLPGVQADGLISLALSRPRDRWESAEQQYVDLPQLAAAYGYALAKNQGYRDANDRVAFMAMYVFLGMNGQRLVTDVDQVVPLMDAVASGDPQELATWIRDHTEPWE
jgi:death-on-curing protein